MPCTYTGSIEGDAIYALNQTQEKLGKQITKTTALLCEAVKLLKKNKIALPEDLKAWSKVHSKVDKKGK